MMIDRLAGNAALKDSVRLMLGSRRLTAHLYRAYEATERAPLARPEKRQKFFAKPLDKKGQMM